MTKRNLIITILIFLSASVSAQVKKQDTGLKREVTLYNPYKPSLPDSKKRSFLPEINDSSKVSPVFHYEVKATPFQPEYTISPIKAAALLPDPLPKLYKSYVKLGLGNYLTPLAEVSITNERSKTGTIGFYARHFSTNGNVDLDNGTKGFAGYMDNDASLFGKRFFRKNLLEGSIDYTGKTRYAYGFSPYIIDKIPLKSEIKLPYHNIGAKASFSSVTLDSTDLSYVFRLGYDYFTSLQNMYESKVNFSGSMSKSLNQLYVGAGINYDHYTLPDLLNISPKYMASISPFIKQTAENWNFKLGFEALLDKNLTDNAKFHAYPNIDFGLNIVPSYLSFFVGLSGKLERNEPMNVISENPYMFRNYSLYQLPNTSHDMIITTGLKGNTGIGGNYLVSASYSLISNMLFFTNIVNADTIVPHSRGNYFKALTDDVDLFNIHAEMAGPINDKFSFSGAANIYSYTLSNQQYAWNKSNWDGRFGIKYNLRDKIIAGVELTAQGKRHLIVNGDYLPPPVPTVPAVTDPRVYVEMPAHFNMNLSAEYRYSKILSFWTKINNISNNRYYEWAYYPTQGFLFMLGLTYSL